MRLIGKSRPPQMGACTRRSAPASPGTKAHQPCRRSSRPHCLVQALPATTAFIDQPSRIEGMTSPHPDPLRWKALTVVCAPFFMTVLDVSVVNVALPSIARGLHFSKDDLQCVT